MTCQPFSQSISGKDGNTIKRGKIMDKAIPKLHGSFVLLRTAVLPTLMLFIVTLIPEVVWGRQEESAGSRHKKYDEWRQRIEVLEKRPGTPESVSGITAGWDKGPYIKSQDGRFSSAP
jgi:hypothetical protein